MTRVDDGRPAFPSGVHRTRGPNGTWYEPNVPSGMTLRQYAAIELAAGLAVRPHDTRDGERGKLQYRIQV